MTLIIERSGTPLASTPASAPSVPASIQALPSNSSTKLASQPSQSADEQDFVAPVGEVCGHIDGEGGFANAAFLIQERDNRGAYISSFVGMCKCGFGGNHILGYRAHRIIYFTYSVQVR